MKKLAAHQNVDRKNSVWPRHLKAKQLQKLGHECLIQKGAGTKAGFSDEDYRQAGVKIVSNAQTLWDASDVIVKVLSPDKSEIKYLDKTKTLISFFWPAQNEALLKDVNKTGTTFWL